MLKLASMVLTSVLAAPLMASVEASTELLALAIHTELLALASAVATGRRRNCWDWPWHREFLALPSQMKF